MWDLKMSHQFVLTYTYIEHDIGACRLLIKGQTTQNKNIWAIDTLLRMLPKCRQRSINLIQFVCCKCLLRRCQVAFKVALRNLYLISRLLVGNYSFYFRRRNLMPHKQSLLKSQHLCRTSKAICSHSSKRDNNRQHVIWIILFHLFYVLPWRQKSAANFLNIYELEW